MRRRPVAVRRGPSLLGVAATTAVVAGTAHAVTGAMSGKQQQAAMANQAAAQTQADVAAMQQQLDMQQAQLNAQAMAAQQAAQQAAPAAAPAAGGLSQQTIDQLNQLGQLRDAGILTEEEFAAKKASILGF